MSLGQMILSPKPIFEKIQCVFISKGFVLDLSIIKQIIYHLEKDIKHTGNNI